MEVPILLSSSLLFNHFIVASTQIHRHPPPISSQGPDLIMIVLFHIDIDKTQLLDSNSEYGSGPCLEQTTYKALLLCEGLVATVCYQTQNPSNHGINLTHYIFFLFQIYKNSSLNQAMSLFSNILLLKFLNIQKTWKNYTVQTHIPITWVLNHHFAVLSLLHICPDPSILLSTHQSILFLDHLTVTCTLHP